MIREHHSELNLLQLSYSMFCKNIACLAIGKEHHTFTYPLVICFAKLDHDCISFQSLGLTQSNLMVLYLLSCSVVGAEVNFDNSKDSGEGCAVNPRVRAPKALVLILVF